MSAPNLGASWQWGQSTSIELTNETSAQSAQILNVSLPVPAACQIFLTARMRPGGLGTIHSLTFNLTIGVGRTSLRRTLSFLNQPSPLGPIEWISPQPYPLTALQCDVSIISSAAIFQVDVGAELAPVTWIPSSDSSLEFGMALPGEAEGLDDDAFDEIQEFDPDLVDRLRAAQEQAAPFPSLEAVEQHARRFARKRKRGAPSYVEQARAEAELLRRRTRNWNGRGGR